MAASFTQILKASGAVTATGNTTAVNGIVGIIGAIFYIKVTAVSGTLPTLDLALQALDPASNSWVTLASLAQKTTADGMHAYIVYPNASGAIYQVLPAQYRWLYTIAGTNPSFTFSIGVSYLP